MRQVDSMFQGAEVSLGEIILHYSSWTPSIGPWGMEGIRLTRIADFPFIRSSERREIAWLQTSLSSLPVCLAIAIAIFFTSFTAALSQPPQRFKREGLEDDSLSLAVISSSSHLSVICKIQAVARGNSSLVHCGLLQWVDNSYVQGSIATS